MGAGRPLALAGHSVTQHGRTAIHTSLLTAFPRGAGSALRPRGGGLAKPMVSALGVAHFGDSTANQEISASEDTHPLSFLPTSHSRKLCGP